MGKLTNDEYTTIKQLFRKGFDGKTIAGIVGRGTGTVSGVKNTKSYEDYRDRVIKQQTEQKPKQESLPLEDKTKKTTLDLREDISIKFSALLDSIEAWRNTAQRDSNVKKQVEIGRAKIHLEEARLWLKETF